MSSILLGAAVMSCAESPAVLATDPKPIGLTHTPTRFVLRTINGKPLSARPAETLCPVVLDGNAIFASGLAPKNGTVVFRHTVRSFPDLRDGSTTVNIVEDSANYIRTQERVALVGDPNTFTIEANGSRLRTENWCYPRYAGVALAIITVLLYERED
ncbi:MAG: hypothetical protein H7Z40_07835 [Phycisphaerae bacterium]|nr:hypothetical protein [Gemmatimonadaceae bacterium]